MSWGIVSGEENSLRVLNVAERGSVEGPLRYRHSHKTATPAFKGFAGRHQLNFPSTDFVYKGSAMGIGPKLEGTPRVTVLICALNEEESIPHVLPKVPEWVDEVLVVDGGSTDRTVELARQLRPDIRILHQSGKGKGDAIKYGVRESKGDIVVTLDADGATDPDDIARFIEPLLGGFDLVKGSRLMDGRPPNMVFHRWVGNRILAATFNALHGTNYTDVCSGYSAFWKKTFLSLDLTLDSFEMEQEALVKAAQAGLRVAEVSHCDNGRIGGVSKISDVKQGLIDWWIIIRGAFQR